MIPMASPRPARSLGAIFWRPGWGFGGGVLDSIHSLLSVGDSWEKLCIFGSLHGLIYEVTEFASWSAAERAAFFTFIPYHLLLAGPAILNWVAHSSTPVLTRISLSICSRPARIFGMAAALSVWM